MCRASILQLSLVSSSNTSHFDFIYEGHFTLNFSKMPSEIKFEIKTKHATKISRQQLITRRNTKKCDEKDKQQRQNKHFTASQGAAQAFSQKQCQEKYTKQEIQPKYITRQNPKSRHLKRTGGRGCKNVPRVLNIKLSLEIFRL